MWEPPLSKSIPDATTIPHRGTMQSIASGQTNSQTSCISPRKTQKQPSVNSLQMPIKCTGSLIGGTGKKSTFRQTSFHVMKNPNLLMDLDHPSLQMMNLLNLLSHRGPLPVWRQSSSGRGIHIFGTQAQIQMMKPFACPVWRIWEHRKYSLLFNNKGEDYAGEWGQDLQVLFDTLLKFQHSSNSQTRVDGKDLLSPKQEIRWPSASELDQVNSILLMGLDMPASLDCSDSKTGGGCSDG